ncbi:hypothetical protein [Clostridium sp.]|uniref:hypothetical protein n=1 Tax=Clostridium sp. TaxID=1506 RepID=UPI001B75660C|nr:hypothetical protein [Clostridium sp.]MBP3916626.1 hypothetical protein [Clostridium sp.]
MNEIEIRRALAILKATRLELIRNNLNDDGLEARYKSLVEALMTRLTILEVKSSWTRVN